MLLFSQNLRSGRSDEGVEAEAFGVEVRDLLAGEAFGGDIDPDEDTSKPTTLESFAGNRECGTNNSSRNSSPPIYLDFPRHHESGFDYSTEWEGCRS